MKPIRVFGISLLCCAVASPVVADVTVKSKGTSAGMVGANVGDMTQQIKGQKVRIDQTTGEGRQISTIIDIAAKQMVTLYHDAKEAEVIDMTSLGETLAKAGVAEINVSITPTTATRQIAGQTRWGTESQGQHTGRRWDDAARQSRRGTMPQPFEHDEMVIPTCYRVAPHALHAVMLDVSARSSPSLKSPCR